MNYPTPSKYILWIGLILLVVLSGLSLYYWQARTLYADAAFQSFLLISSGEPAIMVQRYGAILAQGPALLALKLGFSLPVILKVYSVAFTLYPLVFAWLLWKPLRSPQLALVVILFLGLAQAHTFFWIQNELLPACMLGLLLIGVVQRNPGPAWYILPLWYALLALSLYTHPSVLPIVLFVLVFWGWVNRKELTWQYGTLLLAFVLIVVYKHFIAEATWYDALGYAALSESPERFFQLLSLESTRFFGERLLSTYYLLAIAFVGTVFALGLQKRWVPLILLLGGVVGWLVIVLTRYHTNTLVMYMESYYLPLTIFIGLPLVYYVWGRGHRRWWIGVMLVISIVRITQIIDAARPYEQRLAWLTAQHEQMQNHPEQRFYLDKVHVNPHLVTFDWSVPFETMLLSSLSGPSDTRTLYLRQEWETPESLQIPGAVPTPFDPYTYERINRSGYFGLIDSLPLRKVEPQ